ncbi:MAG: hypothetical protein ACRD0J_16385 [Acidimicrobiales bacterium]
MFPELVVLRAMTTYLKGRWRDARHDEWGGVAERVVLVALFVAIAIAAGAIIYTKVIAKAKGINLTTSPGG